MLKKRKHTVSSPRTVAPRTRSADLRNHSVMSEGTMQRPAERDQRNRREKRARRSGRLLAGAVAVPVMVFAAGCSSDSGSGDGGSKGASAGDTAAATASTAPTVQAAAYKKLPDSCGALSKKT